MRACAAITAAALIAVIDTAPGALEAASKSARFKSLVKQGKSEAHASDYTRAIEAFEAAFALVPSPDVMFEIARCHEKAAERTQAIEAYDKLLSLPHPGARLRAKARKALEALRLDESTERVRMAIAEPMEVETRTSTIALVSAQAELPKATLPPALEATQSIEAEPEHSHVLQISAVSVGGAAIAASAVFGILAFRASHRFDHSSVYSERASLQAEAGRDAHVADAFAIGGVMSAGFGLAFW